MGWRLHDQDPSALGVGLPANLQLLLQPALLFVVSATIFVVLKSTDFLAVDGGLRPLEIYHNQTFFLSGNEHLLYPLDVYLWSRLLQCFGFAARTPDRILGDHASDECVRGRGLRHDHVHLVSQDNLTEVCSLRNFYCLRFFARLLSSRN